MQHNSGLSSHPGASRECLCSKYSVRPVGWTFIPASSGRAVLPSLWNAPHTLLVLSFLSADIHNGRLPTTDCKNGPLWAVGSWATMTRDTDLHACPRIAFKRHTRPRPARLLMNMHKSTCSNHFIRGLVFKFPHTATFYDTCPSLNYTFLYVKYEQF